AERRAAARPAGPRRPRRARRRRGEARARPLLRRSPAGLREPGTSWSEGEAADHASAHSGFSTTSTVRSEAARAATEPHARLSRPGSPACPSAPLLSRTASTTSLDTGHARLRGRLRRVRVPGAGRAGWLLAEAAEQPAPARAAAGTRRLRQGLEGVSPEDDGVEGLGRVARRRGDQRAPFDASSSASPAEGLHWTAEAQRPRPGAASGGGARAPAVGGGSPVVPAVLRAPLSDPPPRGSAEAPRAAADARGSARQTWCDLHLGARQSPGALGRCQEVADEEEDEEDRTGAGGRPGLRAAPQALR
ncbi:unnamed protein product, partial [Prorocentrum cordatum]